MPAALFAALFAAFSAAGFLAIFFPSYVIVHEATDSVNVVRDRHIVSLVFRDRRIVRIVRDRRWPTVTRLDDRNIICVNDTRTYGQSGRFDRLRIGPFDNRGATIGGR